MSNLNFAELQSNYGWKGHQGIVQSNIDSSRVGHDHIQFRESTVPLEG